MNYRTIFSSVILFFLLALVGAFGIQEAEASVLDGAGNCTYIESYMKYGQANSAIDVVRLQSYLRAIEGVDVPINGVYDEATMLGVKAFQERHRAEILAPWGGGAATGYAYITTVKKINEWFCGQAISLDAKEAETINSYAVKSAYGAVGQAPASSLGSVPQGAKTTLVAPSSGSVEGEDVVILSNGASLRQNLAAAWGSFKTTTLTSNWFITSLVLLILILAYTGFLLYKKDDASVDYEEEKA
jgi:hypothetical protein